MLKYNEYKIRYMVRNREQLRSRKPIEANLLDLPRGTMIHHVSDSMSEYGIRPTHPLLLNVDSPIKVHHVEELKIIEGKPIRKSLNILQVMNLYFTSVAGLISRARKLERVVKELRSILIADYSLLSTKYFYVRTRTSFFEEQNNLYHTKITKINEVGPIREHFLLFRMPEVLPRYAKFRVTPVPIPPGRFVEWADHERYGLFYLWNLLRSQNPEVKRTADNVTIAFQEGSKMTQVNLGDLMRWHAEEPEKTEKALYTTWYKLNNTRYDDVEEDDGDTDVDTEVEIDFDEVDEDPPAPEVTAKPSPIAATKPIDKKVTPTVSRVATKTRDMEEVPEVAEAKEEELDDVSKPVVEEQDDDFVNVTAMNDVMRDMAEAGRLSGAEQKRFLAIASAYKDIPNPLGKGTIKDLITVDPALKKLDYEKPIIEGDKIGVLDKSMTRSTVSEFTKNYIRDVMQADIVSAVLSAQNSGILVKDYKVEEKMDALNRVQEHSVSMVPINGRPSTFKFTVPVINEEGEFLANGTIRRLDNQKFDLPIRKINSARVALTSYHSKVFVDRSGKAVNSYSRWISGKITKASMNTEDTTVTSITFSTAALPRVRLPRKYTAIAASISRFETPEYSFNFVYDKIDSIYKEEIITKCKSENFVPCGVKLKDPNYVLAMNDNGDLFAYSNGKFTAVGTLPSLINSAWGEGPNEYSTAGIFGKKIPIVLILGYLMGLDNVLKQFRIPHRWVDGTRVKAEKHELKIKFTGDALLIDTRNHLGSMLFAGFYEVRNIIVNFSGGEFNRKNVYGHILESIGIGRHVLREIGLTNRMFIDPITKELLKELKEPTTFIGLLIRATELLITDEYPDEIDPAFMRIRGYERISGFVYNQLVNAIRVHEAAPNPAKSQVSINPTAVWGDMMADSAITMVEESNPLHNLKEMEGVTFLGQGGRNKKTMVARTRVFHPNDVGLISEATPSSEMVGIKTYLPPNAKLTSLRGLSARYDYSKDSLTNAISSTSLFNVGTTKMDPKRANLAAVQQSSMVSALGGKLLPVRTGYEQVIANRCSDKFAYDAKHDGVIKSVEDKYLVIEYTKSDGSKEIVGVPIGVYHGHASGAIIPHAIVTDHKAGDIFKKGDILAWNKGYFERDFLNPKGCSMKGGVVARIALIENVDTLEDGSAISPSLSAKLGTPVGSSKTLIVPFDHSITKLVKVGDKVDINTVLAIIEDGSLAAIAGDNDDLVGLSKLSGTTPKAKKKGYVSHIEVVYLGAIDNMHPTLKKIVAEDTVRRTEMIKKTNAVASPTGEVFEPTFVHKSKLVENSVAITIFIDSVSNCEIGDKAVFDNVLKSVIGRVMEGENTTEDGQPIDGVFGYRSVSARITPCVESNGVTNSTMLEAGKRFVAIYRGQ